tara:strand:- start:341 stop:550 length:210 start_codon:yes stop_codon:yes gene_type:complete
MVKKEIKEKLLSELDKVNYEYFEKVRERICLDDSVGKDKDHLFLALKYVPNKVIKKWIKDLKKEIKEKT